MTIETNARPIAVGRIVRVGFLTVNYTDTHTATSNRKRKHKRKKKSKSKQYYTQTYTKKDVPAFMFQVDEGPLKGNPKWIHPIPHFPKIEEGWAVELYGDPSGSFKGVFIDTENSMVRLYRTAEDMEVHEQTVPAFLIETQVAAE